MIKIAIIGSGPSALFAAKTILENSNNLAVHIYDHGNCPDDRKCPMESKECKKCAYCSVINGAGGSGLFSDGKLVLDLRSGGNAAGINRLSAEEKSSILDTISETFREFDGVSEYMDIPSTNDQVEFNKVLEEHNLRIKYYPVMHMGTYNLRRITRNFIDYLTNTFSQRVEFFFRTNVSDIRRVNNGKFLLVTSCGEYEYSTVVAAVGKSGSRWLRDVLEKFSCGFISHNYYFGVRLETEASSIENLLKYSFDPKIYQFVNERKVKLHCVCRKGDIRLYNYMGMLFVGGHSPYTRNNDEFLQMNRANFNVMLSFNKSKTPPDELIRKLRSLTNEQVIAQRLGDYRDNKNTESWGKLYPSNEDMICKGNIRKIMDEIDPDFSNCFIGFLDALNNVSEGINSRDNIVYAPAIEWDMDTVKVNEFMETTEKGLFTIGDGAGISQGIVYSSATGILAAREILSRYGN